MKIERFEKILEERIQKTRKVLVEKAKEYAKPENRLHNFDVTARIKGESRERALWGMLSKQITSYLDILDDIDAGRIPTREYIDEKIGDIINYFILTEASLIDKLDNNRTESLEFLTAQAQELNMGYSENLFTDLNNGMSGTISPELQDGSHWHEKFTIHDVGGI